MTGNVRAISRRILQISGHRIPIADCFNSEAGISWCLTLNREYARITQVNIKVFLPVHEKILAKENISALTKKISAFLPDCMK